MFEFKIADLIIILVIVAILFGPGRIAPLASELGRAIHSFRSGMEGHDLPGTETQSEALAQAEKSKE